MQKHGNKYGTHRVIEPVGVLPQPANKLNNNMDEIWDNEKMNRVLLVLTLPWTYSRDV